MATKPKPSNVPDPDEFINQDDYVDAIVEAWEFDTHGF